jgi:hypothetical protein
LLSESYVSAPGPEAVTAESPLSMVA